MLETDALKEKLEMELHRFARPPEELSSGDPYFEQLQTMLAIRDELIIFRCAIFSGICCFRWKMYWNRHGHSATHPSRIAA